ncbi:MAG: hypothetical protein AAGA58_17725 [Verrucomicrobiota bacterium]
MAGGYWFAGRRMKRGILLLIVFVFAGCRSSQVDGEKVESVPLSPVVATSKFEVEPIRDSAPVEYAQDGVKILADRREGNEFFGSVAIELEPVSKFNRRKTPRIGAAGEIRVEEDRIILVGNASIGYKSYLLRGPTIVLPIGGDAIVPRDSTTDIESDRSD